MMIQNQRTGTDKKVRTGETEPRSEVGELLGEQHRADEEEMEEYAGGYLKARHGKVNAWLVVVIVVLIVWGIYYGFTYWGGLGEGLDY
jgi:hypothetical protein